jgi:hypothetical protein
VNAFDLFDFRQKYTRGPLSYLFFDMQKILLERVQGILQPIYKEGGSNPAS